MAYIVKLRSVDRIGEVAKSIEDCATENGFVLEIVIAHNRIQLRRVRMIRRESTSLVYPSKEQWARFNQLVNEVLDRMKLDAYVWSTPFDVKGRYWIRRRDRWEVPRPAVRAG